MIQEVITEAVWALPDGVREELERENPSQVTLPEYLATVAGQEWIYSHPKHARFGGIVSQIVSGLTATAAVKLVRRRYPHREPRK